MWIILFNALDDFGIREVNDYARAGSPPDAVPNTQFEALKRKIAEEGLHGALRIAGLVGYNVTISANLRLINSSGWRLVDQQLLGLSIYSLTLNGTAYQ